MLNVTGSCIVLSKHLSYRGQDLYGRMKAHSEAMTVNQMMQGKIYSMQPQLLHFTYDMLREDGVLDQSWHRRSAFVNDGGLQAIVKCCRVQDVYLRAQAL